MSFAKILAPVDGSDRDACALTTAVRAAKPFNAHVVALFAHPDPAEALPIIGVPLTAEAMGAVIDGNTRVFRDKAKRIHDTIAQVVVAEGAHPTAAPRRDETVTISFREAIGYPPEVIGEAAMLADLTVCGPTKESPQAFETAIDLVLAHHRPILLASYPPPAFRKVVIGWNNGRAAAHAVSAAMPFLEKADIVELICVEEAAGPSCDTDRVLSYLKAHGVSASEMHQGMWDAVPHNTLSNLALDHNADLLVIGAFDHSRIRETVFGGVTNEILARRPLPVLLAH